MTSSPPSTSEDSCLAGCPAGVRLRVRAQPRASRNQFGAVIEGELRVQIAAPPVDATANVELIRFLSKVFSRPKSALRLVRGERSRHKTIEIEGIDLDSARRVIQARNE